MNEYCNDCQEGRVPGGSHKCIRCAVKVHPWEPCSYLMPMAEEGYNDDRYCSNCDSKAPLAVAYFLDANKELLKEVVSRKWINKDKLLYPRGLPASKILRCDLTKVIHDQYELQYVFGPYATVSEALCFLKDASSADESKGYKGIRSHVAAKRATDRRKVLSTRNDDFVYPSQRCKNGSKHAKDASSDSEESTCGDDDQNITLKTPDKAKEFPVLDLTLQSSENLKPSRSKTDVTGITPSKENLPNLNTTKRKRPEISEKQMANPDNVQELSNIEFEIFKPAKKSTPAKTKVCKPNVEETMENRETCTQQKKFHKLMLNKLNSVLLCVKNKKQDDLVNGYSLLPSFPIETLSQFKDFEIQLRTNQDMRDQFVNFLKDEGSETTYQRMVKRCFRATVVKGVLIKFSWTGILRRNCAPKFCMEQLQFARLIVETTKKQKHVSSYLAAQAAMKFIQNIMYEPEDVNVVDLFKESSE